MVTWLVILTTVCAILAETMHAGRCRMNAVLAFKNPRRGLMGAALAGAARVLALALIVAGLAVLWGAAPSLHNAAGGVSRAEEKDRLLIILDASTSMNISDAGADGSETRATRARNLVHALLSRNARMPRTTLMTFAESALPVVRDARDWDVVANLMSKAYYSQAFVSETTDVNGAVQMSMNLAAEWPEHSTTVVLISDGGSVATEVPCEIPASIRRFAVWGVGSLEGRPAGKGLKLISRQETETLRKIANAAGAQYADCNKRDPAPETVLSMIQMAPPNRETGDPRAGLWLLGAGTTLLSAVPLALTAISRRLLHV